MRSGGGGTGQGRQTTGAPDHKGADQWAPRTGQGRQSSGPRAQVARRGTLLSRLAFLALLNNLILVYCETLLLRLTFLTLLSNCLTFSRFIFGLLDGYDLFARATFPYL
ncbi:hypothetical protein Taro_013825 [Colocasia esculenta]|uniref:Uncharacterized protein n=1 Tax=Colocasia esculenta TaxID=4460 RepID=A0A843UD67_COLES|nr:hypothetical protein [Colocasia esculenta]